MSGSGCYDCRMCLPKVEPEDRRMVCSLTCIDRASRHYGQDVTRAQRCGCFVRGDSAPMPEFVRLVNS